MRYFDKMQRWAAIPHATAAGTMGKALATRFGMTTIPALVLLDSNGKVICTDARIRLAADPTGLKFPWPALAGGRRKTPTVNFAMGPSIGPRAAGHRAPSPPATPRHRSAGAVPFSALRPPRLPPPDGGQPPSFTENKHEMAWHDNVAIDQDLARLVVARERATRAPAVLAKSENEINHPPADLHARARRGRDAKCKSPPDIVDAGRPPKKPNRIATRGVPIVYPGAMSAVVDRERAQRDGSFVPRILARHAPDTPSQGKHTSLMHPKRTAAPIGIGMLLQLQSPTAPIPLNEPKTPLPSSLKTSNTKSRRVSARSISGMNFKNYNWQTLKSLRWLSSRR